MGWVKMSIPRIRFSRFGTDETLDWSVVRAVKFIYTAVAGSTGIAKFDDLTVVAGADGRALTGVFRTRYKFVFQDDRFTDESLPSPVSDRVGLNAEALQIVIPRETAIAMDPQTTAIWVYIWSASMGAYYRAINEIGLNRSQMTVNEWGAFQPDGIIDANDRLRIITLGLAYGRRYTPGTDPVYYVSGSSAAPDVPVNDTSAAVTATFFSGDGYSIPVPPNNLRWSSPTTTEVVVFSFDPLPVSQATITSVTTNLTVSTGGVAGSDASYYHVCRVGATNYLGALKTVAIGGSGASSQSWATNPATGIAWTLSELNAASFGVRWEYNVDVSQIDTRFDARDNSYSTPGGAGNTVQARNILTFNIQTSEADLLLRNEILPSGRESVPNNILGIVGNHYERTLCLTSELLHFSDQGRPGMYPGLPAVRVGDGVNEENLWIHKASGAVYIGTTKDIYRLEGDLIELPNGTLNVRMIALNIGSPPVNPAIAVEGNALVYLASDGPRALVGEVSTALQGDLALLLRGITRYGVPAITTSGRHRMAMADGYLYWALPPEFSVDRRVTATEFLPPPDGNLTPSNRRRIITIGRGGVFQSVILRYTFDTGKWSYRPYSRTFKSLTRTPAGSVIGGTSSGDVITLDSGTTDDGQPISINLQTTQQDDGKPLSRKVPFDLAIRMDTGGDVVNVSVHLDGSDTAALTFQATTTGQEVFTRSIAALDPFRRIQLRFEGDLETFKLYDWNVSYRDMPQHHYHLDTGNVATGSEYYHWFREIRILALSASDLEVDVYFDDVLTSTETITVTPGKTIPYRIPLGRGIRGQQPRVAIRTTADPDAGDEGFEIYWVEWRVRPSGNVSQKEFIRWSAVTK